MRTMILAAVSAVLLPASFAAAEGKDGCKCVAHGVRYAQGSLVCLRLPSGEKLARCGMQLNNASWEILHDGCQQTSSLTPRRPSATAARTPRERIAEN